MPLTINYNQKAAGVFTLDIAGSLDTDTHPEFETTINNLYKEFGNIKAIILDLDGLNYISSAGVRVILATKKRLKNNDGQLGVLNMQPQIEKVFDIIKALPSLQIFDSVEEMDKYLAAIQKKVIGGTLDS